MGSNSKIGWTDDTFNPWWGCEKVSPACAHCYAETWAKRTGHEVWGRGSERRFFGDKHWREPLKWNAEVERGEFGECGCGWRGHMPTLACGDGNCPVPMSPEPARRRVFCASMADWLEDREDLTRPLAKLLALIHATPQLDWLLLTKRPENWRGRLVEASQCFGPGNIVEDWLRGEAPHNVWVGTTVENQEYGERRIPALLDIPAKVRFLSCEPMLGPIDLAAASDQAVMDGGIGWVIAGGESGPKARPMHPQWARALRDECLDARVPFYFKQWGTWRPECDHRVEGAMVLDGVQMARGDVKENGRVLFGREWSEFPTREGAV